jgi:hypothetical protein
MALLVEEGDVLRNGVAGNVEMVGREVGVGVADRDAGQDAVFVGDLAVAAQDVGIAGDADLNACPDPRADRASTKVCTNIPTAMLST